MISEWSAVKIDAHQWCRNDDRQPHVGVVVPGRCYNTWSRDAGSRTRELGWNGSVTKEDDAGLQRLPGFDEFAIETAPVRPGAYERTPPWAPAAVTDETLDLEGSPDIDPDEIEWT